MPHPGIVDQMFQLIEERESETGKGAADKDQGQNEY